MAEARQWLLKKIRRLREQFETRYHRPMTREEARMLELAEQLSRGDADSVPARELIEKTVAVELSLPAATDSEPQPGSE
jgi:hypothetical protein